MSSFDVHRVDGNARFAEKQYVEALRHYLLGVERIISAYRNESEENNISKSKNPSQRVPLFLKEQFGSNGSDNTRESDKTQYSSFLYPQEGDSSEGGEAETSSSERGTLLARNAYQDADTFTKVSGNACTCLFLLEDYEACCTLGAVLLREFPIMAKVFGYIGAALLRGFELLASNVSSSPAQKQLKPNEEVRLLVVNVLSAANADLGARAGFQLRCCTGRQLPPQELLWEAHRHLVRAVRIDPALAPTMAKFISAVDTQLQRTSNKEWLPPKKPASSSSSSSSSAPRHWVDRKDERTPTMTQRASLIPSKGTGMYAAVSAPGGARLAEPISFSVGYYNVGPPPESAATKKRTASSRTIVQPTVANACVCCSARRGTRMCGECGVVQYCSDTCQSEYDARHAKWECAMLAALMKSPLKDAGDTTGAGFGVLMIAITSYSGIKSNAAGRDAFDSLARNADMKLDEAMILTLAMLYQMGTGAPPDAATTKLFRCILQVIYTNSFQNLDMRQQQLFVDNYQSFVNHSCDPNTTVSTRTLRTIRAGEEITFSYPNDVFFSLQPTWKRLQYLAEFYRFPCGCSRCNSHGHVEEEFSSECVWPDPFDVALRCTRQPLSEATERRLAERVSAMFSLDVELAARVAAAGSQDADLPLVPTYAHYQKLWKDLQTVCAHPHYLVQQFRCGYYRMGAKMRDRVRGFHQLLLKEEQEERKKTSSATTVVALRPSIAALPAGIIFAEEKTQDDIRRSEHEFLRPI